MRGLLVLIALQLCFVAYTSAWCEPGHFQCEKGYTGCQVGDCLCLDGWRSTFPVSNTCEPICGDGKVVTGEQCDGGLGCCGCKCQSGYIMASPAGVDCVLIAGSPTTTTTPATQTTTPSTGTTNPTTEGPIAIPANLLSPVVNGNNNGDEGSSNAQSSGTVLVASLSYLFAYLLI